MRRAGFLSSVTHNAAVNVTQGFSVFQPATGALYNEDDFVIMTTAEKEKYKCLLPSLTAGDEVSRINRTVD